MSTFQFVLTIAHTVKLGCDDLDCNELDCIELGYKEHLVITNEYFGPKCPFTTQINPVITNLGYNKRILPVPTCSL